MIPLIGYCQLEAIATGDERYVRTQRTEIASDTQILGQMIVVREPFKLERHVGAFMLEASAQFTVRIVARCKTTKVALDDLHLASANGHSG